MLIYTTRANTPLILGTNNTARLTISSAGTVQINGSSVGTLMFQDVTNGASMFYLQNATYAGSAPYNDNKIIAANNSNISFEAGGGEKMRISSGGAVFMPNLAGSSGYNDLAYNTANGQLIYRTSSIRYKENIQDFSPLFR